MFKEAFYLKGGGEGGNGPIVWSAGHLEVGLFPVGIPINVWSLTHLKVGHFLHHSTMTLKLSPAT